MNKWVLASIFFANFAYAGNSPQEISLRCGPASAQEPVITTNDFQWNFDIPGMLQRFAEMYRSPKRLSRRAYWDPQQKVLKLPFDQDRGGDIVITENFVKSIGRHIELAFERQYIDAVFFPDMGHSHLLIPQQIMQDKYDKYPVEEMSAMFRDLFQDENIGILYHTAEQLRTLDENRNVLDNEKIRWRHQTRNIIGKISPTSELTVVQNPASKANTVNEIPGHYWWGAGFNLSAQKEGCFEYQAQGKTYFFDISMYDLEAAQ